VPDAESQERTSPYPAPAFILEFLLPILGRQGVEDEIKEKYAQQVEALRL
jgi:hypothetical protein